MRECLVEFTENGARIIKDKAEIEAKKNQKNVVLSPDLTSLVGVSPSDWRLEDGKIVTDKKAELPLPFKTREMARAKREEERIKYDLSEIRDEISKSNAKIEELYSLASENHRSMNYKMQRMNAAIFIAFRHRIKRSENRILCAIALSAAVIVSVCVYIS